MNLLSALKLVNSHLANREKYNEKNVNELEFQVGVYFVREQ